LIDTFFHILKIYYLYRKQIPNIITEAAPVINFNAQHFKLLQEYKKFKVIPYVVFEKFQEFSENFLFIGNKKMWIHRIMSSTKISDNLLSFNE